MVMTPDTITAFVGTRNVASGDPAEVMRKAFAAASTDDAVLFFDDRTGRVVDADLRAVPAPADVPIAAARAPGRPKLGVVAREVTLLPRHWEWLGRQPGGASVALRKLVEEARRSHSDEDVRREACEAAYAFMSAMAGDARGFEEAARALFAKDTNRFRAIAADWPADVAAHVLKLAAAALPGSDRL